MTTYVERDAFLRALTITEEDMEIPGLGTVKIKPLTLVERDELRRKFTRSDGDVDVVAMQTWALIKGMVRPKLEEDDIERLRQGRAAMIDEIVTRIIEASGMAPDFTDDRGTGSSNQDKEPN